ncbi:MAG: DUF4411 family protein [Pseudonocardiaceae bacterium]
MSQSSKPLDPAPALICVIDTSVLIELKTLVKMDDQWEVLAIMVRLVEAGSLTFPRQVVAEMQAVRYPDAPGAWMGHAKARIRHPQPREDAQVRVLAVAEQLVDVEASHDREVADPYVAAMALELSERYTSSRVVVATNDTVDRLPVKLSLAEGCRRLHLDCWKPDEFLSWVIAAR